MLYIFGGLPGTGKSTLSQFLARDRQCVHLRIDTIEHALCQTGSLITGSEGYAIAYSLAEDNLRLGLSVVADIDTAGQTVQQSVTTLQQMLVMVVRSELRWLDLIQESSIRAMWNDETSVNNFKSGVICDL